MKILGIDSSAITASAAIFDNGKTVGEMFVNAGLTHSQTLMPMVQSLLKCTNTDIADIDVFAVSVGPGSFTGLRIGIGAVKGMALALDKPCIAVSTLEAIAYPFKNENAVICAVMDARCNQVYNALFRASDGRLERICDDRAISVDDLFAEIARFEKVIFAGDGALLCTQKAEGVLNNTVLPLENLVYQRASSICALAYDSYINEGGKSLLTSTRLMPVYLRPSQAEREYRQREQTR